MNLSSEAVWTERQGGIALGSRNRARESDKVCKMSGAPSTPIKCRRKPVVGVLEMGVAQNVQSGREQTDV